MRKNSICLLLIPGVIVIILFLLIPILNTIMPTFIGQSGLTLNPYVKFFKDSYFTTILVRTLKISLISTVICIVFGVPVSYFISKSNKKVKGILLVCTVFPLLTNSVVRSFAWITILGKSGLINKILISLHLFKEPQKFLYTEFAIIIGCVYLFLPLMIVSMIGVMDNIEDDLLEAARSLGANKITAFLKVIFPLSVPGIIVGSILVFTGTMTAYTTPQLLGGNSNTVMSTLIYQKAMTLSDWNGASIISAVMIVLTLLVTFVMNKIASKLYKRGV